jgi:hypothetical protein
MFKLRSSRIRGEHPSHSHPGRTSQPGLRELTHCRSGAAQCLYPLDLPKDVLFQPYERQQQVIASTSYLAPPKAASISPPATVNAVASSSRTSPAPTSVGCARESGDLLYKTPTGLLEIAYPDPEERHL